MSDVQQGEKQFNQAKELLAKLRAMDQKMVYLAGLALENPGPFLAEHTFPDGSALILTKDQNGGVSLEKMPPQKWSEIKEKREQKQQEDIDKKNAALRRKAGLPEE